MSILKKISKIFLPICQILTLLGFSHQILGEPNAQLKIPFQWPHISKRSNDYFILSHESFSPEYFDLSLRLYQRQIFRHKIPKLSIHAKLESLSIIFHRSPNTGNSVAPKNQYHILTFILKVKNWHHHFIHKSEQTRVYLHSVILSHDLNDINHIEILKNGTLFEGPIVQEKTQKRNQIPIIRNLQQHYILKSGKIVDSLNPSISQDFHGILFYNKEYQRVFKMNQETLNWEEF